MKSIALFFFLVIKGLSSDSVGVARGTVFLQELQPGAGFVTGEFIERKVEGALP